MKKQSHWKLPTSFLFWLITLFIGSKVYSQNSPTNTNTPKSLSAINDYIKEDGWHYFTSGLDSTLSANIFTQFKTDFGLTESDNMRVVETHIDKLGYTHTTYKQYFNNIPVEGSMLATHGTNNKILRINGNVAQNLKINSKPNISEEIALKYALEYIGADLYAWEDTSMENSLKLDSGNPNKTFFPTGQLIIARNYDQQSSVYQLTWKFHIVTSQPEYKAYNIYIDASDGSLIQSINKGMFCNGVVGSGNTLYGIKNFDARHQWFVNNIFTLQDCDRGNGIHTKKYDGSGPIGDGPTTWSSTDQVHGHGPSPSEGFWNSTEAESSTAHWLAQETYDCFQDNFDRNNFDGTDSRELRIITEMDGFVAAADYYSDAGDPSYLGFGYHPEGGAMERTDIVGHEWTHLFTTHELDWAASAESQAINEAISDIFGNYVEAYITGVAYDYLLGEDVHTDRSMSDPEAFDCPDTYAEIDLLDLSGVNSGPMNKMFHLLSAGGTHPETGVAVTGIGVEDAMQIMYKVVEDDYISGEATYASARTGCINAAKDLFGDCSVQARQVARAFGAIGVGTPIATNMACAYIMDVVPYSQCEEYINSQDLVFTAQFLPSTATVVWNIPSGWTATLSGTGNSICTITHVSDATTKTISASVTTVKGTSTSSFEYDFQDCIEEGCPPLCRFDISEDAIGSNFTVYPNPANSTITIFASEVDAISPYKVFNSQGSAILEGMTASDAHSIDISQLPSGFYVLYLYYENNIEMFKLIVN